jgi:hypothetical protein
MVVAPITVELFPADHVYVVALGTTGMEYVLATPAVMQLGPVIGPGLIVAETGVPVMVMPVEVMLLPQDEDETVTTSPGTKSAEEKTDGPADCNTVPFFIQLKPGFG